MSNTIRVTLTQKAVDADDNTLNEGSEILSSSFSNKAFGSFTLTANSAYKSVSFGQVTTATTIILKSNENLTVKLDGGSQELTAKTMVLRGDFSALQIKNPSSSSSEVEYEVYGS